MNLYLVRHGEAAPVGGTVQRDADRALTKRGEDDVTAVAGLLARLEQGVSCILTSPLNRAVQTARILSAAFEETPEVKTTDRLSPGFHPNELLAELATFADATSVIAVGHQPDLGVFIAHMITEGSPLTVAIPPGAAAKMTLHPSASNAEATLRWLLPPEDVYRITQQKGPRP